MANRILFIFILSSTVLFTVNAQTLSPDSLMQRVEDWGQYLLYRNHDSTYIKSYADKFTLKLVGVSKFHYFKIKDKIHDSSIRFRPDRRLNLGIGASYKWVALDVVFNVGISEKSNFSNSKYLDFQGTIFSSKQYISSAYQYYYGYQISNFEGVPKEDIPSSTIRDDIRTVSFVLQYLFAFNYDKFSLKAPFIQNEIQRKSAGSFLVGARFHLYNMDADSSAIPMESQGYFSENLHLTNITAASFVINLGYMYTFVWDKNYYITIGLVPGFGLNLGDYKTDHKRPLSNSFSMGIATMNAIGYNSDKFYGGLQLIGDTYRFQIHKKMVLNQGYGKLKFFIGYRFG